jgi:hypothetical protein
VRSGRGVMVTRRLISVAAMVATGGCYFHSSVLEARPESGSLVMVTLTTDSNPHLWALLGAEAHVVEGRVMPASSDTLMLAVRRVTRLDGHDEPWHGEPVGLPRSSVVRVERRWLSIPATTALVGGVLAGLVVAAEAVKKPPVQH